MGKKLQKKVVIDKEIQRKYKRRFALLKKQVKQQVFLNGALFDEIGQMEQQFLHLKSERRYLLKRLFKHLPMTESQVLQSTRALNALETSHPGKIPHSILSAVQPGNEISPIKKKSQQKTSVHALPSSKKGGMGNDSDNPKPKRKKPGTAKKKVQPLHMGETKVPLFPITLGTLTIYDLGEILPQKQGFHSERYIWPVGYCSTRLYPSMQDPDRRIQYFCYIKDGGNEPLFEIIAEDEVDKPVTASTATACHCIILKRLNKARGKETTNTGSGPEFFGFSHSTIQYLIQCLPGADECDKYIPSQFEFPPVTSSTAPLNVIREDNLPDMTKYDRTVLELPDVQNKMKE